MFKFNYNIIGINNKKNIVCDWKVYEQYCEDNKLPQTGDMLEKYYSDYLEAYRHIVGHPFNIQENEIVYFCANDVANRVFDDMFTFGYFDLAKEKFWLSDIVINIVKAAKDINNWTYIKGTNRNFMVRYKDFPVVDDVYAITNSELERLILVRVKYHIRSQLQKGELTKYKSYFNERWSNV